MVSSNYSFQVGTLTNKIVNANENNNSLRVLNVDTEGNESTRGKFFKKINKQAELILVNVDSANVKNKMGVPLKKIETTTDSLHDFFFNALKHSLPSLSKQEAEQLTHKAVKDVVAKTRNGSEVDVIQYHDELLKNARSEKLDADVDSFEKIVPPKSQSEGRPQATTKEARRAPKTRNGSLEEMAHSFSEKYNIPVNDKVIDYVNKNVGVPPHLRKSLLFLMSVAEDIKKQERLSPDIRYVIIEDYLTNRFDLNEVDKHALANSINNYFEWEEWVSHIDLSERGKVTDDLISYRNLYSILDSTLMTLEKIKA